MSSVVRTEGKAQMMSVAAFVAVHAEGRGLVGFVDTGAVDPILDILVPDLGARMPVYEGAACVWRADFGFTTHESFLSDATLARYGRRRSPAAGAFDIDDSF